MATARALSDDYNTRPTRSSNSYGTRSRRHSSPVSNQELPEGTVGSEHLGVRVFCMSATDA